MPIEKILGFLGQYIPDCFYVNKKNELHHFNLESNF